MQGGRDRRRIRAGAAVDRGVPWTLPVAFGGNPHQTSIDDVHTTGWAIDTQLSDPSVSSCCCKVICIGVYDPDNLKDTTTSLTRLPDRKMCSSLKACGLTSSSPNNHLGLEPIAG